MKTATRILCVALTILTMASVVLFSAKTAESDECPLQVEIALDKTRYFVSNNVKAAVTIRNDGKKDLQNLVVCVYSDKHQLLFGSQSVFDIAGLKSGKSETVYVDMALKRNAPGLTLMNRIILFFTQLHKNYTPFPDMCEDSRANVSQSVQFRHGSATASLRATVWYESVDETTLISDISDITGIPDNPDNPPHPQVTYLDKYMVDILESGTYTAQMETKSDEMPMQVTMYVKGNDRAMEIPISSKVAQSIGLPSSLSGVGKVRIIIKNVDMDPKAYVTFSNVGWMEIENVEDATNLFEEAVGGQTLPFQLQFDSLQYCGQTAGIGYVCETYQLPEENLQYNFYFTQTTGYTGIVRWDMVDLINSQNNASMNMRLFDKVTDSKAFTVSGKKMDPSELEGLFS